MTIRRALASTLILACAFATGAAAQAVGTLTGTVTYSGNGDGVPGVRVLLADAQMVTASDDDGHYRLESVPLGRQPVSLFLIGCQLASRIIDVPVGETLVADFVVGPPVINLDRLVVIGVAARTPQAELPFTVDRLEADELRPASARTVADMIQGRIAGAKVVHGSGQPGEDASIVLRSATSIQRGSQDPLIVVDGVISQRSLSDIDPMDVDRVEVLKGAAAAASYGSRAEAGVIEITTKRGVGRTPRPSEPLVVLNGVVSDRTLAEIDLAEIEDILLLRGAAGAVIYGPEAEAGAIQVTTRQGASPSQDGLRAPDCISGFPSGDPR